MSDMMDTCCWFLASMMKETLPYSPNKSAVMISRQTVSSAQAENWGLLLVQFDTSYFVQRGGSTT